MSAETIRDRICQYFGGTYDTTTRTYRAPQIAGLGVTRKSWAKRDDHRDYYLNMAPGTATGSQLVAQVAAGTEKRVAFGGATSGGKKVTYDIDLHFYIRSTAGYAEDVQDDSFALLDAALARLRADRTCGSGGLEQGGFQIGEGADLGLSWEMSQARSTAEGTRAYLRIYFQATEYVEA